MGEYASVRLSAWRRGIRGSGDSTIFCVGTLFLRSIPHSFGVWWPSIMGASYHSVCCLHISPLVCRTGRIGEYLAAPLASQRVAYHVMHIDCWSTDSAGGASSSQLLVGPHHTPSPSSQTPLTLPRTLVPQWTPSSPHLPSPLHLLTGLHPFRYWPHFVIWTYQ